MSRRAVLFALLISIAVLAGAVAPWTVSSGRLAQAIARELRTNFDLELQIGGKTTIALLPVPRIKIEDASLVTAPGSEPVLQRAVIRGEFRILPLFLGRVEVSELGLSGGAIVLEPGMLPGADGIEPLKRRLGAWASASAHLPRIVLTGMQVRTRGVTEPEVGDINVVANWATPGSSIEIAGSFVWRGESIGFRISDFRPLVLAQGGQSPFETLFGWKGARVTLRGQASFGQELRVTGRASLETASFRDLLHWFGVKLPLGETIQALTLEGDFEALKASLSFPTARLTLGANRLDGAIVLRPFGERVAVTGALSADRLNLSEFVAPVGRALASAAPWDAEPIDLAAITTGDLDIRISAAAAQIGAYQLQDVAANLLVKPNRLEIALGRATLDRGVVKGRLGLTGAGPKTELRLQGSLDKIDAAALLSGVGQVRWLAGPMQAQVAVEAQGESLAAMAGKATGRAAFSIRQGELIGIDLGELVKRVERRPLSTSFDWRGGRTSLDHAQIVLAVANGAAEIAEGQLIGPGFRGMLSGRIALPERSVAAKAVLESPIAQAVTGGVPGALSFDIGGPWDEILITPDVRALLQRSGAARNLQPSSGRAQAGDAGSSPIAQ